MRLVYHPPSAFLNCVMTNYIFVHYSSSFFLYKNKASRCPNSMHHFLRVYARGQVISKFLSLSSPALRNLRTKFPHFKLARSHNKFPLDQTTFETHLCFRSPASQSAGEFHTVPARHREPSLALGVTFLPSERDSHSCVIFLGGGWWIYIEPKH